MKTIYKSIVLEAALLSVTLALQAEIQSEGETVTADVQASTLDRLKVTLVSPNVSGARDLVASGNATIDGSEIAVNLENLAFGTHRLVVSARFGTQIRTLYALDISVPQAELPNETQEYEDSAIVVSTYGDGGGEFPTDYAKQGDDPTATLTDTQAYAQAAAEAAQSLIAVDADVFAGKQALATNISAKGVPTSVADALTVMATKVLQIPQQVNTGVSEFEQMIAPSPYMWNVYAVANDLMKQTLPAYIPSYMAGGNYAQYRANNAFFVGEYYRGYDSLELTGADGYLTHDGCFYTLVNGTVTRTAPDGTITTYEDTTIIHTWLNDSNETYMNRWVAFFYLTNAYSFINTNAAICPRRVALCGVCNSFVVSGTNRLTDVWVIGSLDHLEFPSTGNDWSPAQVIRNYISHASGYIYAESKNRLISVIMPDLEETNSPVIYNSGVQFVAFPKLKDVNSGSSLISYSLGNNIDPSSYTNLVVLSVNELEELKGTLLQFDGGLANQSYFSSLAQISANKLRRVDSQMMYINPVQASLTKMVALKSINFPNLEYIGNQLMFVTYDGNLTNLTEIRLPKLTYCGSFLIRDSGPVGFSTYNIHYSMGVNLIDVEVGEMTTNLNFRSWNPTDVLADATKKAQLIDNIKNHILARVSDATGGTQLVFTVSTDMYNAIASETITWQDQTMTLADAFLTKNWLLAGA